MLYTNIEGMNWLTPPSLLEKSKQSDSSIFLFVCLSASLLARRLIVSSLILIFILFVEDFVSSSTILFYWYKEDFVSSYNLYNLS